MIRILVTIANSFPLLGVAVLRGCLIVLPYAIDTNLKGENVYRYVYVYRQSGLVRR